MWSFFLSVTPQAHIAWLTIALALATLFFIRAAFFPRRRGDTPFCPRCRYDLSGADLSKDVVTCVECGKSSATKALIRGIRPKRPLMRSVTVLTGLLTTALATLWGVLLVTTVNWWAYAPEFALRAALTSPDPVLQQSLILDLDRRLGLGQLSNDTLTAWIDAGLAAQASTADIVRSPLCGSLMQFAARGVLKGAQFETFLDQAVRISKLRLRPYAAQGRPFRMEYDLEIRVANPIDFGFSTPTRLRISGMEDPNLSAVMAESPPVPWPSKPTRLDRWETAWPQLKLGPAAVELEIQYSVFILGKPVGTRSVRQTAMVDVVAPEQLPPVQANCEQTVLTQAAKKIQLRYGRAPIEKPQRGNWEEGILNIATGADLAASGCFTIYGEIDGHFERVAGPIFLDRSKSEHVMVRVPRPYQRIHLDPEFRAAANETVWTSIIGQRLIYADIPEWESPGTTPGATGSPAPPLTADQRENRQLTLPRGRN